RQLRPGERVAVGRVAVEATPASHAWQSEDPAKHGPPFGPDDCLGFLVETPDGTRWHPGPRDAARLADAVGAPTVIPHHYGCYDAPDFAAVNGDPAEVAALMRD